MYVFQSFILKKNWCKSYPKDFLTQTITGALCHLACASVNVFFYHQPKQLGQEDSTGSSVDGQQEPETGLNY